MTQISECNPILLINVYFADLQQTLLEYDRKHKDTSYISEAWFDIYLKSRVPCPVNFNPFMTFAPAPAAANNDQVFYGLLRLYSCSNISSISFRGSSFN